MLVTEASEWKDEIMASAVWGGVDLIHRRDLAQALMESNKLKSVSGIVLSDVACYDRFIFSRRSPDGVQFPEAAVASARIGRNIFNKAFVGRSVHSVERALWAAEDDVDYLVAGTIYRSLSHPDLPGQGTAYLKAVCDAVAPLPVIAIGGITPERVGECIAAGAAGVAVLSPIMQAEDPRAVARAYRTELDRAWSLRSTENR